MPGPAPKPTALKELAGNPGRRPLNQAEPKPRLAAPPCPDWLQGDGRAEYDRLVEILLRTRVLTESDWAALIAFVTEYDGYVRAIRRIRKEGELLTSKAGGKYINPRVGLASMHFKQMSKLMGELGLTPASRTRISALAAEEEQSLASLLFSAVSTDADG